MWLQKIEERKIESPLCTLRQRAEGREASLEIRICLSAQAQLTELAKIISMDNECIKDFQRGDDVQGTTAD